MNHQIQHYVKKLKTINLWEPNTKQNHPRILELETPNNVRKILRVLLRNPWNDYSFTRYLDQSILARCKLSYFRLVNIRELNNLDVLERLQIISKIYHPNISILHDVYLYEENIFLVTEALDISIINLELQKYLLEEWEIATIITEVLKGIVYISSINVSGKNLSYENIQFTLRGDVKLFIDLQTIKNSPLHETSRTSQVLLDFPILVELLEDMILSRYHLISDEERWSKDLLDFVSCILSGSLESVINHSFLRLAMSPQRLIPRIRFAYENSLGRDIIGRI